MYFAEMKSMYLSKLVWAIFGVLLLEAIPMSSALTGEEAISLLEKQRAAIQDYNLVISRSFYHVPYSMEKAWEIAQKVREGTKDKILSRGGQFDSSMEKKIDRLTEMNAITLSNPEWNGNIYSLKGIGTKTHCYKMGSFLTSAPQKYWLKSFQDELDTPGNLIYRLSDVVIQLPGIVGKLHIGEKNDFGSSVDLFQPSQPWEMTINELSQENAGDRWIFFPLNHEKALAMARNAELQINETLEDNFLLRIHPLDSPDNRFIFEVTMDSKGKVYKYSKKHLMESGEEWVEFYITYHDYIPVNSGKELQIPRIGIEWTNERNSDPEKMDTATIPLRETSTVMTILSALVNVGYVLDDLSIDLPKGSSIVDYRTASRKRVVFDEPQHITISALSGTIFK